MFVVAEVMQMGAGPYLQYSHCDPVLMLFPPDVGVNLPPRSPRHLRTRGFARKTRVHRLGGIARTPAWPRSPAILQCKIVSPSHNNTARKLNLKNSNPTL